MDAQQKFESEKAIWSRWHDEDYLGVDFVAGLKIQLKLARTRYSAFRKMYLLSDCREQFFDFNKVDTKDWNILEIGCGCGFLGMFFVDHVKKYFGVDIDEKMINKGNQALHTIGIKNAELFCVDSRGIDIFDDGHFDFIFCENAFIHIPSILTKQYLRQTAQKLKTEGWFLFEFNTKLEGEGVHRNTTESYTPEELEELFKDTGLQIKKTIKELKYFAPNQRGLHVFGDKL